MSIFSFLARSPGAARPSPTRPGLEGLEERQLLSTISGYVFHDSIPNGLFGPGDAGINGNTLLLYRGPTATGTPIAAATSGTSGVDGFYQFTNNQTIPQTPTTLPYQVSFANKTTNWTQTGTVAQFDPSLGALQSIRIVSNAMLQAQFGLQSFDGEAATIGATVSGNVKVSLPGVTPGVLLTTPLAASDSFNAAAYDPANYPSASDYFGGPSGQSSPVQTRSGSQSLTITDNPSDPNASLFQAFEGTGSLTVSAHAGAAATVTGPGNVLSDINTSAGGQVQVIYTYIPSNALLPGTYTIVQKSTPPGYLPGLKSSGGVVIPNSTNTNSITVTLTNGDSTNNNFAELKASSLSGHVYLDLSSGLRTGFAGLVITLTGSNDLGTITPLRVVTQADGSYSFGSLRPGSYTITETPPAGGYIQGQSTLGTLNGAPAGTSPGSIVNNDQFFVTVGQAQAGVNYDFHELLPPTAPQVTPPVQPVTAPPSPLSKVLFLSSTLRFGR
jgi:hypothetical protein